MVNTEYKLREQQARSQKFHDQTERRIQAQKKKQREAKLKAANAAVNSPSLLSWYV